MRNGMMRVVISNYLLFISSTTKYLCIYCACIAANRVQCSPIVYYNSGGGGGAAVLLLWLRIIRIMEWVSWVTVESYFGLFEFFPSSSFVDIPPKQHININNHHFNRIGDTKSANVFPFRYAHAVSRNGRAVPGRYGRTRDGMSLTLCVRLFICLCAHLSHLLFVGPFWAE